MNQSSYIVAALLGGFVLYIAAKQRLQLYTAVIFGSKPSDKPVEKEAGKPALNPSVEGFGDFIKEAIVPPWMDVPIEILKFPFDPKNYGGVFK